MVGSAISDSFIALSASLQPDRKWAILFSVYVSEV